MAVMSWMIWDSFSKTINCNYYGSNHRLPTMVISIHLTIIFATILLVQDGSCVHLARCPRRRHRRPRRPYFPIMDDRSNNPGTLFWKDTTTPRTSWIYSSTDNHHQNNKRGKSYDSLFLSPWQQLSDDATSRKDRQRGWSVVMFKQFCRYKQSRTMGYFYLFLLYGYRFQWLLLLVTVASTCVCLHLVSICIYIVFIYCLQNNEAAVSQGPAIYGHELHRLQEESMRGRAWYSELDRTKTKTEHRWWFELRDRVVNWQMA